VDHPKPWLRYVEADKVDDKTLDVDDMLVRNSAKEKLGNVDGFIVDSESGRPYYLVVDAGGWFKSKQFLVPIGQVQVDDDRDAFVVGLSKEQIHRFPGFDSDEFEKLKDRDIKRINDQICDVYQPGVAYPTDEPYFAAWARKPYRSPDWWRAENSSSAARGRADAGDTSPHLGGRAQPGDVLGLETGGERTNIGDTDEDENERRRDAEKAAATKVRR
jgi:PRC-barrel domain